jgi:hypothetical protein
LYANVVLSDFFGFSGVQDVAKRLLINMHTVIAIWMFIQESFVDGLARIDSKRVWIYRRNASQRQAGFHVQILFAPVRHWQFF